MGAVIFSTLKANISDLNLMRAAKPVELNEQRGDMCSFRLIEDLSSKHQRRDRSTIICNSILCHIRSLFRSVQTCLS